MTPRPRLGTAAVEYAILLPILLLFVLGIIDFGRLIWTETTLNHAVEAAARCGAIDKASCGGGPAIQAKAVTEASPLATEASNYTVLMLSCGVQVSATLTFTFTVPWMGATKLVQATACYPI